VRALLISFGAATALGAAIAWAPLPASLFQGDGAALPKLARPPSPMAVAPVAASRAAGLVQFGPDQSQSAQPKPGPPILVGVIGSGPRRIAYVMFAGQTTRAGLWDKVGPWRVTGIGPRGVTLQGGGKKLTLGFYGPRPTPPAPLLAADVDAPAGSPPPPAPASPPPPMHALEPASAPRPQASAGKHPRYWAGPPGSAPPGYIQLKPGELPPR
jgi:hypothetical protein